MCILVSILLAVYNGEKYLKEQIESILSQTYKDIKIIIRDDGSSDESKNIINNYCNLYPDKIFSISGNPTGSAKLNFAELLKNCDSEYIMFCDQDDVWLPSKIELTLNAMKSSENEGNTPVLVHTDLQVADENLGIVSPSFFEFNCLKQDNMTLPRLLVQNYVTGCTIMINRALKQKCGDIPPECLMHDWWLALVALMFGKLVFCNDSTILYRQHCENQVGAKAAYGLSFIKQKLATIKKVKETYNATYAQAEALIKRYGEGLSLEQRKILKTYCDMKNMRKFKKIRTINKFGFKKCTKMRVMGQYFLV